MSDQLSDLREDLQAHIIATANLPEFITGNVILGDAQEAPEDFDKRRASAIGKIRHKLGLVLYESVLSNEGENGDLDLVSQHLIEFYRSPQRNARQARSVRASEPIILDLIRTLHGWRSDNNDTDGHCDFDFRFLSAVPIADPHYEAWLLTFNCHIDLSAVDYYQTKAPTA
ncbi:hypothetical protein AAFN60_02060 [Roseibacillus persicicus]|uniref:hypothetical protein n=1 Tax=Roseibacillus persicicus TaxID=454148 RepID=UPI00398ADFDB